MKAAISNIYIDFFLLIQTFMDSGFMAMFNLFLRPCPELL